MLFNSSIFVGNDTNSNLLPGCNFYIVFYNVPISSISPIFNASSPLYTSALNAY